MNLRLNDEDQKNVDSKRTRKIFKERLPSKSVFQKSKNGDIIERRLYKTKAACDPIYQLNLEMNQQAPPKSWIEHKKMQSFDAQTKKMQSFDV